MKLTDFLLTKPQLNKLIINAENFYAHLSKNEEEKETLIEHTLLVQTYFFKLVKEFALENVIENLVIGISDKKEIQNFLKDMFVKVILLHDFGKVNPDFQIKKMKNSIEKLDHNLSTDHSIISAYIFTHYGEIIAKEKYKITEKDEQLIDFLLITFSYPILKHHSAYLDSIKNIENVSKYIGELKKIKIFFSFFQDKSFFEEIDEYVFCNINQIVNNDSVKDKIKDFFALFVLVKLSFSLLTGSDYYATSHFINNLRDNFIEDFGIITDDLRDKIIKNIKETKKYNKDIYESLNKYQLKFPEHENNNNLNKLRQNLSYEVIKSIREHSHENLFYIEAPTGGGKTNLSLLAVAEILKKHNIKKVFYVFPFTTLITQTYKTIKETLNLDNYEIIQIHSKTGFNIKEEMYGEEWKNVIDYQFINYPIILLSHIKFFDILKSNEKLSNYLLYTLSNSIVIIDELQSYPPDVWDKLILFIYKFSRYFNIKFILMSATLPKIDKLLSDDAKNRIKEVKFINLIKDKNKYFQNPNFKNRVRFDFSMLKYKAISLEQIKDKLLEESEKYRLKNGKVHTIIEFIFKKTASQFYRLFNEKGQSIFDEVFLLSGDILEPRRKEIIEKLKSEEYQNKSILLITTQVVEAGVDIDMDIGFKDSSIVDSDEQLAGRINRNVKKKETKLFIFNFDNADKIYKNDLRFKLVEEKNLKSYSSILKNKLFDELYSVVIKEKNKINQQIISGNLYDFLKHIKRLDFQDIDNSFKIIDNSFQTLSIFMPLKIPVKVQISNEKELCFFTQQQCHFLQKYSDYNGESKISGETVWQLYEDIITNKKEDFIKRKFNLIFLQGIMSQFVLSLHIFSRQFTTINSFAEFKHGFHYLHNPEEFYSLKEGFLNNQFKTFLIY